MPRNQERTRRDINRLHDLVQQHKDTRLVLGAIETVVANSKNEVETHAQGLKQSTVDGTRERAERDAAILRLRQWVKSWREAVLLLVPGASDSLRALPAGSGTHDDWIRLASDMMTVVDNANMAAFAEKMRTDLGDAVEAARKETAEAAAARPKETEAQAALTKACGHANEVIARGARILRTLFGSTSPEYKQFVLYTRNSGEDDNNNNNGNNGNNGNG